MPSTDEIVEQVKAATAMPARKDDTGKPPIGLLPSDALVSISGVLAFGAKKYAAHNWRKGIVASRLYDAAQRHLLAWNDGEDLDAESGLSHLAHAGCCLLMLISTLNNQPALDDRYKKGDQP